MFQLCGKINWEKHFFELKISKELIKNLDKYRDKFSEIMAKGSTVSATLPDLAGTVPSKSTYLLLNDVPKGGPFDAISEYLSRFLCKCPDF